MPPKYFPAAWQRIVTSRSAVTSATRTPHVIFIFLHTSFSKLQGKKMVVCGESDVSCLCRKLLAKAVCCCCTQVKGTYANKYSLLLLVVYVAFERQRGWFEVYVHAGNRRPVHYGAAHHEEEHAHLWTPACFR